MQYRIQQANHREFSVYEQKKRAPRSYFIPYSSKQALQATPLGRQRYESDLVQVLSGTWDFLFCADATQLPRELDTETVSFDSIQVPSTWQRTGYAAPAYINSRYEFTNPPPEVPATQAVGVYRKTFTIETKARHYLLSFLGVASCLELYCNGYHIGYSEGAHNTAEFDLSDVLQAGSNEIVAVVYQWCTGSFLEAQDMFREKGIFRDVLLQALPEAFVHDVWLHPQRTAEGEYTLRADVDVQGDLAGWNITLESEALGLTQSHAARDRLSFKFEKLKVTEWNAEVPTLYDIWITLSRGNTTQVARFDLGFRNIEIKHNVFYFNHKKIKLKGVNHHDTHGQNGYVMSFEDLEHDLTLMKQLNVNTIRTSHYPPDPHLLQLANRMGFYVIDEADIETHGMAKGATHSNINQLSDDPEWLPRYLDRVKRMFFRDRNNACVTMWSLGNESGGKHNQDACAKYLHATHPEVPVHYAFENSHYNDEGCGYDVYSKMYTWQGGLQNVATNTDEYWSQYKDKPFFLCEYAHAMGNGPGGLESYWETFYEHDCLLGGCVWEWADHAVFHGEPNARYRWTYGGDHGETAHDGKFCCDGLVYPDRRLHTGAKNLRNVYRPVRAKLDGSNLYFENTNRFAAIKYNVRWVLVHNGEPCKEGTLELELEPKTRRQRTPRLPELQQGDYDLQLFYYDQDGTEIAFEQHSLQEDYQPEQLKAKGRLNKDILKTLQVNVTRAHLDNDPHRDLRIARPQLDFFTDLAVEQRNNGIIKVTATLKPPHKTDIPADLEILRFGVQLKLPRTWEHLCYCGLGETENLPDFKSAALTGVYQSTVAEQHEPYIYPQDNSNHGGCRWLTLTDAKGKGIRITNAPQRFSFSVHHYSQDLLAAATHDEDLHDEGAVFLSIDGFVRGSGSASCGADTEPAYRVYIANGLQFSFEIIPLAPATEPKPEA